jgi:hypothetical protein
MYQGTQGYSLMKKTEGRKSRDTVSLKLSKLLKSLWKISQIIFFLFMEYSEHAVQRKFEMHVLKILNDKKIRFIPQFFESA